MKFQGRYFRLGEILPIPFLALSFMYAPSAHAADPGGVTGATVWVRSDDAGTIATGWKDQSTNNNPVEPFGTWALTPADSKHNFHPYTTGYTTTRFFRDTASFAPLGYTQTSTSIFSAVRATTLSRGRIVSTDNSLLEAAEPYLALNASGQPRFYKFTGTAYNHTHLTPVIPNETGLPFSISNDITKIQQTGLDGSFTSETFPGTVGTVGDTLLIGRGLFNVPGRGPFPGDIMEVIWFSKALTDNERDRVNSYLAVKNGVTLSHNYISSSGGIYWSQGSNAGFNSNIAGFGRDDISALNQIQSNSINTGNQVIIGVGNGLHDSLAANPNTISSNVSYLTWGDNGANEAFDVNITPSGNNYTTMNRVWKVQRAAISDNISIAFPTSDNLVLITSASSSFTGNHTAYPLTQTQIINGVTYQVANDISALTVGTQIYFTFASVLQDRSDAPVSYGEATHIVDASIRLGLANDVDAISIESADASGEGSDDDGISAFPTITDVNTAYTLPAANIAATGTGTLHGWIDFDGNGTFDADEHDSVTVTAGTVSGDLSWAFSDIMTAGDTYARFRLTSDVLTASDAATVATDGEVEDYQITVIGSAVLSVNKTVEIWDPMSEGLYSVPGNDIIYTLTTTNSGSSSADIDSIILIDAVPDKVEFYNNDIDDGGPETDPVSFSQASGTGLTFTYGTDVKFSDSATAPTTFGDCLYSPGPSYDPNVSYVCVNPKGAMAAGDPDPNFDIKFRARIK